MLAGVSIPTAAVSRPPSFGRRSTWESAYVEQAEFSWYCGWADLEPFWAELCPTKSHRVLLPGVGNDKSMVDMFDAGWSNLAAFDYAEAGVARARELFGARPVDVRLADARDLPYATASFDAALEKGALDSIQLGQPDRLEGLRQAVDELTRVVRPGGVLLSVTAVATDRIAAAVDATGAWTVLRDGSTHITDEGFATTNVDATLLAWERRSV